MQQTIKTTLAIVFFCLLCSQSAMAQSQPPGPWVFKIDGGGAHQSNADLDDAEGAFEVDRWFVSAGLDYGWSRRDSIGVSVGVGNSDYDFDNGTTIEEHTLKLDYVEIPVLAVASACAAGESVFMDMAELRVKESDRLRTTAGYPTF